MGKLTISMAMASIANCWHNQRVLGMATYERPMFIGCQSSRRDHTPMGYRPWSSPIGYWRCCAASERPKWSKTKLYIIILYDNIFSVTHMVTNAAATGNHFLWKRRLLSHQRIEWIDDLAESSQPAKNIWDFVTTERDMWHCDIMWPWNLEMYPAKMGISTREMGHVSTWYRQLWPPQKLPNGTWRIMMDLVCN